MSSSQGVGRIKSTSDSQHPDKPSGRSSSSSSRTPSRLAFAWMAGARSTFSIVHTPDSCTTRQQPHEQQHGSALRPHGTQAMTTRQWVLVVTHRTLVLHGGRLFGPTTRQVSQRTASFSTAGDVRTVLGRRYSSCVARGGSRRLPPRGRKYRYAPLVFCLCPVRRSGCRCHQLGPTYGLTLASLTPCSQRRLRRILVLCDVRLCSPLEFIFVTGFHVVGSVATFGCGARSCIDNFEAKHKDHFID